MSFFCDSVNLSCVSIIAVDVDGKKQDTIPSKNGNLNFKSADCNNNATGSWDKDNWRFLLSGLKQTKTKCTLYFTANKVEEPASESMSGILQKESTNPPTNGKLISEKNGDDTNLRYIGANPNNYVYFNCNDLSNQSATTCETWRIIGLMDNIENADGEKGKLLKIIRKDSLGDYSWDSSSTSVNYGYGVNEWSQADIQTVLNYNFLYRLAGGFCYGDSKSKITCPDWVNVGIKKNARALIQNVKWNTGTVNTTNFSSLITPEYMYKAERSSNNGKQCTSGSVCTDDEIQRTTEFIGYVGLMYPSDYGYATNGGVTGRDSCLKVTMNKWSSSGGYSYCNSNDWLYASSDSQWTMTPAPSAYNNSSVFEISSYGGISYDEASANYGASAVRPVVYLKSSVKINGGDGTAENPYFLMQ